MSVNVEMCKCHMNKRYSVSKQMSSIAQGIERGHYRAFRLAEHIKCWSASVEKKKQLNHVTCHAEEDPTSST